MDIKLDPHFREHLNPLSRALLLSESQLKEAIRRSFSFNENADLSPLQGVFRKAKSGQPITVAAIGGSITQGASAKSTATGGNNAQEFTRELGGEKCWVLRVKDWFCHHFSEEKVTVINAGIGATPSFLGGFRLEKMVLRHQPDLVFVEFSVNDPSTYHNLLTGEIEAAYEGLLRRLAERGCAVIPIFVNDRDNIGMQKLHSQIACHYRFPSVSYYDAISPDGALICDWLRLSPDEVHPNNVGHALLALCLCSLLNHGLQEISRSPKPEASPSPLPPALFSDTFHRVEARFAKDLAPDASEAFRLVEDDSRYQCKSWDGFLISESGRGKLCLSVPKGVRRLWIQYHHAVGSYETEFLGQTKLTNTSAIGWPRAMWDRIYTGAPLEEDSLLRLKTHEKGTVVLFGVLMAY